MPQVVILVANGEKRTVKAPGAITANSAAKLVRKTKAATLIGTFPYGEKTIHIWGWKEGKAGTENKHELPSPHDTELLFGDLIASVEDEDFTVELWDAYCTETVDEICSDDDDEIIEDIEEEADVEVEEEVEEEVAEEDESEIDEDDDCYDDGEEAGGGSKRRAPRRKTAQSAEYRRIDMGLKARIKLPSLIGKRAPRWQTDEELVPEEY